MTSFNDLFSSWYNLVMIGRLASQISVGTRFRALVCEPMLAVSSPSESVDEAFLLEGTIGGASMAHRLDRDYPNVNKLDGGE